MGSSVVPPVPGAPQTHSFRKTTLLEKNIGKKASVNFTNIQPGDVKKTFANIELSKKDLKFKPKTAVSQGIPKFINWYKNYYKIQ